MIKIIKRTGIFAYLAILISYFGYSQPGVKYEFKGKYFTDNGQKLIINSSVLQESKEIYIGLPANYSETKSYPLVIVLEAEVLFETIAPLTRLMSEVEEIPECIVVGIPFYNKHLDYAPALNSIQESGNADRMLQFYSLELFPLIDSLYKSNGERIIWAHSGLGGIFCTYLLLGPDTQFNGILSSSPNLKWMKEYIDVDQVFENVAKKDTLHYYLTFGGAEEEAFIGEMYENVIKFKQVLELRAPENLNWSFELKENNNHFTNAIETYIDGLKFYFASTPLFDE